MTDSENELVARLRALFIMDEVGSNNPLGRDAADALEAAWRERDEARSERDWLKKAGALVEANSNAANDRAEAAEAEVRRLTDSVTQWQDEAIKLEGLRKAAEAQVARLREALQFYADENVWRDQPYMRIDHLGRECEDMEQAAVFGDYGDIARAALEAKHD